MTFRFFKARKDVSTTESAVIQSQRELEDVVEDLLTQVHGVPKRREIVPAFDTEDIT